MVLLFPQGNVPDVNTVAKMVLNDWLRGKIPYFVKPPGVRGGRVGAAPERVGVALGRVGVALGGVGVALGRVGVALRLSLCWFYGTRCDWFLECSDV